jgi:raffinose/stachyose/melibiose transport system permease protein
MYTAFVLYPLANAVWLSFFEWNGIGEKEGVGLENYADALSGGSGVPDAFVNAAILACFFAVCPIALALAVTAALARVPVRGLNGLGAILFMPQVIAPVVVGVSWVTILDLGGPVNDFLRLIGLGGIARAWLGDYTWALPSLGIVGTWATFGLCMVLFISGVQQIPRSLFEAARVEGAGPLREFRTVTLPGIRNQLAIAMTLTIMSALRTFDLVWVTTKGGPGNETLVPSVFIYLRAFVTGAVGSAAAVAILLTVLILVITLLITRFVESGTDRDR